ncbi:DUF1972 domain-containing protein [Bacteroidota bacterium]
MKIAITGTRGIPNHYGGFEQFVMQFSARLVDAGHEVIVYNPHGHPYKDNTYRGVKIIRKWLPEMMFKAASNYLFDRSSLRDAAQRDVDIILECGYASAAPWYRWLRKKGAKLITHMDGMEWQRAKWNLITKKVFRKAERTAVKYSDALVCDNPVVADYYRNMYSVSPEMIPYGAVIPENWNENSLIKMGLEAGTFYLIVARLEPENNIRLIIKGFLVSNIKESLVIVGDYTRKFGHKIFKEFGSNPKIRFLGGIYDHDVLDNIRHYSKAILHGHSVGGTNPSLLEGMAAGALIIAHNNPYNKWVLGENALFFSSKEDVKVLLEGIDQEKKTGTEMIDNNLSRIRSEFQWSKIVTSYLELFNRL